MRLLLLAIQIENIESFFTMPSKTHNLKVYHPLKHRIYLYFKYLTQNPMVTLSFILLSVVSYPSDIAYIIFLLLIPLYQCHPFFIYGVYSISSFLDNPLILLIVFFFRNIFIHSHQIKIPDSLKIVILCLMIPKFSTILLILFPFILSSDLSHAFNRSKKTILRHKSYYMITKTINKIRILNPQMCKKIITYTLLIVIISMSQITILPLLLTMFIYLLLYEIDVLIQYHFFNQSQIYHDRFSRNTFYFIILNGISFLLIGQLFDLPHFPFILWYSLWSIIFILRNFKWKIMILLPLFLSGCQDSIIHTHTVQSNSRSFIGEMIPKETQTIVVDRNQPVTIHVKDYQHVNKGDLIITYTLTDSINEIKRMNYQIHLLEKNVKELETLLKSETIDQTSIEREIATLEQEIKIIQFDMNLIAKTKDIYTHIDGVLLIQDDTLKIQSKNHILSLTLTELEYRDFIQYDSYEAFTLDDQPLDSLSDYQLVSEARDTYTLNFDFFENETYPYQSVVLKPQSSNFTIPESFVYEDDEGLYVWINREKRVIEGEKINGTYEITKGLNENEVLEALD